MKTLMYLTMTLNGYIANFRDECPWPKEVWSSYYKISQAYKAIIVGRKTYEIMNAIDEFKKIGNPFVIVLTKRKMIGDSNVQFVSSVKAAVKLARLKGFSKVLISGGGAANSGLIKEGFVDEVWIDIVPLLFGKGTMLFAESDFEKKLKFTGMKMLSKQVIQLHYKVLRHQMH